MEEIKLKNRDESEMNFEQAQAGNEVQKALAENCLFAEGLYGGLKNNPCIWLSAALKFKSGRSRAYGGRKGRRKET
jgi:hypothetical protein